MRRGEAGQRVELRFGALVGEVLRSHRGGRFSVVLDQRLGPGDAVGNGVVAVESDSNRQAREEPCQKCVPERGENLEPTNEEEESGEDDVVGCEVTHSRGATGWCAVPLVKTNAILRPMPLTRAALHAAQGPWVALTLTR